MYRAAYHHTVQKWAKLPALMAQPHHISTAYTRLHCIQLSVFTAAQHSVFFQTRTILKTALSKRELDSPSLKDKIEQEALHWEQTRSKMECQPVGMWDHWLSEFFCVFSATVEVTGPGSCLPGLHIHGEFIKRLMLGTEKLALSRQKANPKNIYLFWLMIGQVILPSVTWLFFRTL